MKDCHLINSCDQPCHCKLRDKRDEKWESFKEWWGLGGHSTFMYATDAKSIIQVIDDKIEKLDGKES